MIEGLTAEYVLVTYTFNIMEIRRLNCRVRKYGTTMPRHNVS
jgi:hypothetical protein